MTSAVSNHTHQISVALPDGYTKDHPVYPVLHSADANAEFGTVVETARLASFSKEITTREASVADAAGEATSVQTALSESTVVLAGWRVVIIGTDCRAPALVRGRLSAPE